MTKAGERAQALPDGSEVLLRAHSSLTVDDTGLQRVAFQEAGEITYNIQATQHGRSSFKRCVRRRS